jgi:glycosyltransferase involved in cell wall biosynthesis
MTRILFIHNKIMWYRIPLFQALDKLYSIKFIFTDEEKVEGLSLNYEIIKRWGKSPFSVGLGLVKKLSQEDYDIVIFPPMDAPGEMIDNIFCYVMASIRRKPYMVWSERWHCSEVKKTGIRKLYEYIDELLFGYFCRHSSACLTSGGSKQKEYFISHGVEPEKIFIIPYLSDVASKEYHPEELKRKKDEIVDVLRIENKKIILCVARLVERKGIDYLIKAFAQIRESRDDVVLLIIGGGCYYGHDAYYGDKLVDLCEKNGLGDSVRFLGYMSSEEIPFYYYLCDLLVFPSIAMNFADTGCLPVSDAMYFEKPVISTDVVAFAYDLIHNGVNGYIVPQKDEYALTEAINKVISNSEVEKKMGIESKKILQEKFQFKDMILGFKNAFQYVIKKD